MTTPTYYVQSLSLARAIWRVIRTNTWGKSGTTNTRPDIKGRVLAVPDLPHVFVLMTRHIVLAKYQTICFNTKMIKKM